MFLKGDRLKELRLNRGLTQEELGKVIDVTKASICCYEKGSRTPTLENLIDLMMFFDVSSDYLLGNDLIITVKSNKNIKTFMTKEEVTFIEELRKDKFIYEVLLTDPVRGIELLGKKIN
ncbi:MAG: helix-turn-helix transcriptional regulator [Bacilli bacterium]